MRTRPPANDGAGETRDDPASATRRRFLLAGGAVALGGLAGCSAIDDLLDDASEAAVGTTTATPAVGFAGDAAAVAGSDDGTASAFAAGVADVRYVPGEVRVESRGIDLEGWSTATATKAQDYNSSRSNKPSTGWWGGPDGDDEGDARTAVRALALERDLLATVDVALAAIDRESAADSERALDVVAGTIDAVRAELDGCSTGVCRTVRENADGRLGRTREATAALDASDWAAAREAVREVREVVVGDVDRLAGALGDPDSDADGFGDLDSDDDGLLDAEEDGFDYLGDEPTVAERFVVSLPDAELPGDRGALVDELTPERVLEFFLGERDAEGCLATDSTVVVHRDLACRTVLTARLDEENDKGRGVLAMRTGEGGAVVTGASLAADAAVPMVSVAPDGAIEEGGSLDDWGAERRAGAARVTPTLVCPAVATPPDCPCPLPALFFVRRVRHDDQVLFAGGWLLDDGALYEDAATLLVAGGTTPVVPVTPAEAERAGADDGPLATIRKRPGRAKYGNITLRKDWNPGDDHLPAGIPAACKRAGTDFWAVQSRPGLAAGGGDCDDDAADDVRPPGATPATLVTALDAPLFHLVDAAKASNEVKFKAGAELSKAVN